MIPCFTLCYNSLQNIIKYQQYLITYFILDYTANEKDQQNYKYNLNGLFNIIPNRLIQINHKFFYHTSCIIVFF